SALLRGHSGRIDSASFGPDGALYTAGGDGSVRAWPAQPATRVLRAGSLSAFRLAFVAPQAIAATDEDGTVSLFSLATGERRQIASYDRQAYGIQQLSGGRFATSSWDGSITVFGSDGTTLRRFNHGAEINALAATPGGSLLATTGVDGAV